jgi:hypothetical protein
MVVLPVYFYVPLFMGLLGHMVGTWCPPYEPTLPVGWAIDAGGINRVPTRMHMATNVLPCTTAAKAL